MEQEDEVLSQWQAAQHQFAEVGQASAPGQGAGAGGTKAGGVEESRLFGCRSSRDGVERVGRSRTQIMCVILNVNCN